MLCRPARFRGRSDGRPRVTRDRRGVGGGPGGGMARPGRRSSRQPPAGQGPPASRAEEWTAWTAWTSWTGIPKIAVHKIHIVHSVHRGDGLRATHAAPPSAPRPPRPQGRAPRTRLTRPAPRFLLDNPTWWSILCAIPNERSPCAFALSRTSPQARVAAGSMRSWGLALWFIP